jgi:hypothetical protein
MEILGSLVIFLGSIVALVGWIWLIVIGFQRGGVLWAVAIFFLSWVGGLIFCIVNKTGWLQLAMIFIGGILAGFGAVPMIMKSLENLPK